MEAPPPAAHNADPDGLLHEIERLRERAGELEHELAAEREHSATLESALKRQRQARSHLHDEAARLRTQLEQGQHETPPPAWADRPVNPALRTKWRWILRLFALLVLLVVLGAVYLVIHAYITHESIQHVWSQVRSPF